MKSTSADPCSSPTLGGSARPPQLAARRTVKHSSAAAALLSNRNTGLLQSLYVTRAAAALLGVQLQSTTFCLLQTAPMSSASRKRCSSRAHSASSSFQPGLRGRTGQTPAHQARHWRASACTWLLHICVRGPYPGSCCIVMRQRAADQLPLDQYLNAQRPCHRAGPRHV